MFEKQKLQKLILKSLLFKNHIYFLIEILFKNMICFVIAKIYRAKFAKVNTCLFDFHIKISKNKTSTNTDSMEKSPLTRYLQEYVG